MNRAIILHGMPSKELYYDILAQDSQSNSHWLPWLQQRLCQNNILSQTPEMPVPFQPNYIAWKNEFDRFLPDNNTLLVGHSCGAGFIIRWLSENPNRIVGKVVLVAPWIDIEGEYPEMFNFVISSDINKQVTGGIDVIYSTDDQKSTLSTVEKLRQSINGLNYHEFSNYGHFTIGRMKTREFPELLQICLNK